MNPATLNPNSDWVMSGYINYQGRDFRIDLAHPDLFAQWVGGICKHLGLRVNDGGARIIVTYAGPSI